MKKLLIVLSVFCYTATMVSAQVDDAVKVENAVDELSPAAKAAAEDATITSKACAKDGKVCYMRKGEGDVSTVVQWDAEQGKFVDLLDKDGKPVTCSASAKTCSKSAAKTCSKDKGAAAKKTCSKDKGSAAVKACCKKDGAAAKTCSKDKGAAAKKTCSKDKGAAAKTCSHGAKSTASATENTEGTDKVKE